MNCLQHKHFLQKKQNHSRRYRRLNDRPNLGAVERVLGFTLTSRKHGSAAAESLLAEAETAYTGKQFGLMFYVLASNVCAAAVRTNSLLGVHSQALSTRAILHMSLSLASLVCPRTVCGSWLPAVVILPAEKEMVK